MKDHKGKARMSLVLRSTVEGIARVRGYGADKYGDPENWKTVSDGLYWDAILRHVYAAMDGEQLDKESGLPHLAHAACNVMFLLERQQKGISVQSNAQGDSFLKKV